MFNVLYISCCHVLPSVDIFAEYQVNIQLKLPINYLGPGETRRKYSGQIRFVAELTRDNTDKKYVRNAGVSSYHPPTTQSAVSLPSVSGFSGPCHSGAGARVGVSVVTMSI